MCSKDVNKTSKQGVLCAGNRLKIDSKLDIQTLNSRIAEVKTPLSANTIVVFL